MTYASDAVTDEMGNSIAEDYDGESDLKGRKGKKTKKNSLNPRNKGDSAYMSIDEEDEESEMMEGKHRSNSNRARQEAERIRSITNDLLNQHEGTRLSPFDA